MRRDDLRPDAELHDVLRRFDSGSEPTEADRRALERRIAAAAEPLLAARRGTPPAWWEFAATWARTLIPLGIATAITAAAVIRWTSQSPRPRLIARFSSHDSMVAEASVDQTSRRLLDLLMTPSSPRRSPP